MREYLSKIDGKYVVMFDIGIATGLRISDILNIRAGQVKTKYLHVTEIKTKKKRLIEFDLELREKIKIHIKRNNLLATDFLVFSSHLHHEKKLSRVQAFRTLKKASYELGLENVGTHSLRKTYALNHFKQNKNIAQLQQELNHKYMTTTLMYLFNIDDFNKMEK